MNRMVLLAAAIGAAGVLAAPAAGQSADWSLCAPAAAGDWERAIAACSRLVAAGTLKSGERAAAHVNRGTLYLLKGDAQRAIKDYDAALKLEPDDVVALNRRGEARSRQADFVGALADYDEAVRLNPRYPLAFRNRARIHFYRGDFAAAAEDFRSAEAIDRGNAYSLLWRYVAEARAGVVDQAGLERGSGQLREGWPKPLVLHFLGRLPRADVLATAAADTAKRQEQECEAHFFLGQKHILAAAKEAAVAELRQALTQCPGHMVEHHATRVELRRFGAAAP
ncbi:MAG TPA: tetratricopeptide repeat protein [Alphaproteobacteria bacterium]|jgi:lipoprotein NlpI